jgi:hypothetical protein
VPENDAIVRRAQELRDAAGDAIAWLDANSGQLKENPTVLVRDFGRFRRRADRLRIAAGRRACITVFGASQAGKSYLVSGLATPPGKPLFIRFGDQNVNFLRELNPQGGKESTGLVSRFTVRPTAAPTGMPVPLRLLSQTDVVKVLGNTFLEDFKIDDISPPEPAAITAMFDRLARHAGAAPQGSLTADDIEDMQEYFELHFGGHALMQALRSNFWSRAATIIPRLPPQLRAEAYAPLWNGTAAFTQLAQTLILACADLDFADTAFAGAEALLPREESVLDVNMLFGLGAAGSANPTRALKLQSGSGKIAHLPRSVVAALIAEVTLPLAQQPWEFFETIDLLDFPGARSREEIVRPEAFLAEPGRLGRVFLRGKVAYLFQRYQAEQEMAAMMLCVGPSNQDVQTLPRMVSTWVDHTIGATPQARMAQTNSLFLVLTQFDKEFEEKAGEDVASGQRWTTRLEASLLEFFGKSYVWPREWVPNQAFDNTVWLRSTAIGFKAVFDYAPSSEPDAPPIEQAIAPRAMAEVAAKKAVYLDNALVRTHFADPGRAWDEALRPNDGGIRYLVERLQPVCRPQLKSDQITGRLEDLAIAMAQRLRPYFHTGDTAAEVERANQNATKVTRRVLIPSATGQTFGMLLRALQVTSDQMQDVWWQFQSEPENASPVGVTSLESDYESDLGLPSEPAEPPQNAVRDRFERFADLAIAAWGANMSNFLSELQASANLNLPLEEATILVGEIALAARRHGLRAALAAGLRQRAVFQARSIAAPQIPVIIAEKAINDFVYWLGYDQLPPEKRPTLPKGGRRIFAARAPVVGMPPLAAQAAAYDKTFHIDWMCAMAETFRDNARDPSATGLDFQANAALGSILARFETQQA